MREDRAAFTRKTTDKTNRYVDVNIIRDLLLIQPRCPVSVALDPGQLNIRFEIYSIDCALDSSDLDFTPGAQSPQAIRDIFHRDVGFPSEGMGSPLATGERRHRYTQISAQRELYIRTISLNVLTKEILLYSDYPCAFIT